MLDKPLGVSSAGAVARIKRLFGARKVGHTGSLDPLATGMLPICLGEATKFGAALLDADKTYRVVIRLGERTPTADRETEVIERRLLPTLSHDSLVSALAQFPRDYAQVPPMHSALKQDGRPLYEYARAGITRERAARMIRILEMNLLDWTAPEVTLDVRCTKGAYIRVLAEDLAAQLGTIGFLAGLRRLAVAPFSGQHKLWSLEALGELDLAARLATLLPVDAALCDCPRLDLTPECAVLLRRGQPVAMAPTKAGTVRIYGPELMFLGLGELTEHGFLVPIRLISADTNRA